MLAPKQTNEVQLPGTVVSADDEGIVVVAAEGAVKIERLRPEGKTAMDAATFLRGHKLHPGSRFGE
ncbi:MAG: hypothetical protein U1D30_09030 [Planctomycetota bacterium]